MAWNEQEELSRISDALLEEEPESPPKPAAPPVSYGHRIRNTDQTDIDPEEYAESLELPRRKTGLVILILLLMAAAFLGLAWWISRNGGLL